MRFIVTGGCGFVGSSVASQLIRRGQNVIVFDNLSRLGGNENLQWLRSIGPVDFVHGDIRNQNDVAGLFRNGNVECVFHLAGQVAMTTSVREPRKDFETNVVGTINVLEAIRNHSPTTGVMFASSNKVYGDLSWLTLKEAGSRYTPSAASPSIDENAPLSFRTPYGCSKGAAEQYILDYARTFSLRTVVLRHSTIYGGRQFATFDQGWVSWFCKQALVTTRDTNHRFTVNGDGKQVRDLLHVDDAVDCYLMAQERISSVAGEVFNIGGGVDNSLSVLELLEVLAERLNTELKFDFLPWRNDDQRYFVADIRKATSLLEWSPKVSKTEGITEVLATLGTRSDPA